MRLVPDPRLGPQSPVMEKMPDPIMQAAQIPNAEAAERCLDGGRGVDSGVVGVDVAISGALASHHGLHSPRSS